VKDSDLKIDVITYKKPNNKPTNFKGFVKITHKPSGIALTQRVIVSQFATAETIKKQLEIMVGQWNETTI